MMMINVAVADTSDAPAVSSTAGDGKPYPGAMSVLMLMLMSMSMLNADFDADVIPDDAGRFVGGSLRSVPDRVDSSRETRVRQQPPAPFPLGPPPAEA